MWIPNAPRLQFPPLARLVAGHLIALLAVTGLHAGSIGPSDRAPSGEPSAAVLELLERDELPEGVVFEIIENDRAALSALLPEIRANITRLRERDPGYPVAVVSHGAEQFTLTRGEATQHPGLHDQVEAMVRDEGVNVYVCGTFAEWRDVDTDAFADFVEVADLAPARLDDYRKLGFEVIRLRPSLLDAPSEAPWEFDFGTP